MSNQHTPEITNISVRHMVGAGRSGWYYEGMLSVNAKIGGDYEECRKNLIALLDAAPELLAACKAALVGVCEAHGFQAHILTQIQAAIAKAEGRE